MDSPEYITREELRAKVLEFQKEHPLISVNMVSIANNYEKSYIACTIQPCVIAKSPRVRKDTADSILEMLHRAAQEPEKYIVHRHYRRGLDLIPASRARELLQAFKDKHPDVALRYLGTDRGLPVGYITSACGLQRTGKSKMMYKETFERIREAIEDAEKHPELLKKKYEY